MIQVEQLSKKFGDFTAVDQLSFKVGAGEVLGFLGPNGAGKSTTMKMITGFLSPTVGTVSVCGHDIESDAMAAKTCMGYLPEGAPLYPEMTVWEFLNFIADVRNLSAQKRKSRLDEVIGQLHLEQVLQQSIETLSKGFKRRVGLAQAILHDPKVLILDEPTDGLDPNQKFEVRSLINGMASDKIIIISTHILEEVHAVCSRAIIIAHGKILADDTPSSLEAQSRYHHAVQLTFGIADQLLPAQQKLAGLTGVAAVEVDDKQATLTVVPSNGKPLWEPINEVVRSERWNIDGMQLMRGQLDEVFRQVTVEGERSS